MSFTHFSLPINIIGSLPDRPVTDGGLTSQQFKDRFDANADNIKSYLNDTLCDELDTFQSSVNTHISSATTSSHASGRKIFIQTTVPQSGAANGIYLVYQN